MGRIIAFSGLALTLAGGVLFAPLRDVIDQTHQAATAVLLAGGLFTVALAVLIKE